MGIFKRYTQIDTFITWYVKDEDVFDYNGNYLTHVSGNQMKLLLERNTVENIIDWNVVDRNVKEMSISLDKFITNKKIKMILLIKLRGK